MTTLPTFSRAKVVRCNPNPSARVFCFGHAGSSGTIYTRWQQWLPADIQVCPVVLPGRGIRMNEDLYDDIRQVIFDAKAAVEPYTDLPYAMFGHSMGAIVAFETLKLMEGESRAKCRQLFVAACAAPQLRDARVDAVRSDEEALDLLKSLNGTPVELLQDREAIELFLPAFKADIIALSRYEYVASSRSSCPITAFGGQADKHVTPASLSGWRDHTTSFRAFAMSGDHFSMLNEPRPILDLITIGLRDASLLF